MTDNPVGEHTRQTGTSQKRVSKWLENMIRELQVRNKMRDHCVLTSKANIKKTDNTKCW